MNGHDRLCVGMRVKVQGVSRKEYEGRIAVGCRPSQCSCLAAFKQGAAPNHAAQLGIGATILTGLKLTRSPLAVKSLVSSADAGGEKRVKITHAEVEMVDHSSESLRVKVERLAVVMNGSRAAEPAAKKRSRQGEISRSADCIEIQDDDDQPSSSRRTVCCGHTSALSPNVVDLCDSDEPEELDRCDSGPSKAIVDLCNDSEELDQSHRGMSRPIVDLCDDGSLSQQSASSRSTQWLHSLVLARGFAEEEEEKDDSESEGGYDATKDILASQRRTLEDWAHKQFEASGCKVQNIRHNPKSYPGENLYEAFAAGYKLARNTKSIELKFHGTPESNVDSIMENGLDPLKRNGQAYGEGEYFGGVPHDSIGYCRGGNKMLIFAVLMDDSGLTFKGAGGQHTEVSVALLSFQSLGGVGWELSWYEVSMWLSCLQFLHVFGSLNVSFLLNVSETISFLMGFS